MREDTQWQVLLSYGNKIQTSFSYEIVENQNIPRCFFQALKVGALNGCCFLANVFFLLMVKRIDNQQWRTTHNNAPCFEKNTPWQILLPYEDKIQFFVWSLLGCQCGSMEISEVVFNHSSQAKKKVFKNMMIILVEMCAKCESIKDAINTNFIWGSKLGWLVALSPLNNNMLSYLAKNMKPH